MATRSTRHGFLLPVSSLAEGMVMRSFTRRCQEQHALQHCAAWSRPTHLLTLLKEHVGLEVVCDVLLQGPVLPNSLTVAGEVRCLCSLCKTVVSSDWLCQLLQQRAVLSHDNLQDCCTWCLAASTPATTEDSSSSLEFRNVHILRVTSVSQCEYKLRNTWGQ